MVLDSLLIDYFYGVPHILLIEMNIKLIVSLLTVLQKVHVKTRQNNL